MIPGNHDQTRPVAINEPTYQFIKKFFRYCVLFFNPGCEVVRTWRGTP